ncbi:MAG: hypothetical protein JRH16_04020 [Deltaproteobacteria bacterium]|nr:hypothetical protein [Deltaproteobacteria bacterium]MBW2359714.1 hypothetical protein [Deltaproteobacteria bacterium]
MTAPDVAGSESGAEGPPASGSGRTGWPRGWPLLLYAAFAVLSLSLLRGALEGRFVSDDGGYIVANLYLREINLENVTAFFDPASPAQLHAVGNYSPIHLLLHAVEWQIFADHTFGYHLVNILVHALVGVLFLALLLASRAPPLAALAAALLFVVHPGNVQAVAWISQLKSTAGLAFAFGALLCFERRPWLALGLFALALLTKAAAAFAIPMGAALLWARAAPRRAWLHLGLWLLGLLAYSVVEFAEFRGTGWVEVPAYADPLVQLRSIAAYAARYLVMAATSWGVSAYHEPDPVLSWFDPWWLAALPLGALLAWRTLATLVRREEEAAWWLAAAAAWFPISQLFPFPHAMADHYLYFMLPGLLGGSVLALAPRIERASQSARHALAGGVLVVAVLFGWHSSERAKLWENDLLLTLDAAANYPNGRNARLLRARSAAQTGDVARAIEELRGAEARGMFEFRLLDADPGLAPLRGRPQFEQLVRDWAALWIDYAERTGANTQTEQHVVAQAHRRRGELAAAEASYQRALAAEGSQGTEIRQELESLRRLRRLQDEAP